MADIPSFSDGAVGWGQAFRDIVNKLNRLGAGYSVRADSPGIASLTAVTADGTGDNSARIQGMADYAKSTWGGGYVDLPIGTMRCLTGLTIPEGVQLRGAGKGLTTLNFSAAGSSVVAITGGGRASHSVTELKLVGPNGQSKLGYPTNSSTGLNLNGIDCRVTAVGIESFFYGIDLTNTDSFFFHGEDVSIGYAGVGLNLNGTAAANGGVMPTELGERMVLSNSVIFNSKLGFDLGMSGVTLFATNCSFDYLGKHGKVADSFCHLTNCHLETGYAPTDNGNWGSENRYMIEMALTGRATFTACRFEVREAGVYSAITPYAGPSDYNSGHVRFNDCTWYGLIPGGGSRQYNSRDMRVFQNDATTEITTYSPFATKWNTLGVRPVSTDGYSVPAGWSVRIKSADVSSVAGGTPSQAIVLERNGPAGATAPYPAFGSNFTAEDGSFVNTYDVGDIAPLALLVDPSDTTTIAALTARDPDGAVHTLAVVPNGDRSRWTAGLRLTTPGLWRATWTVTGTGEGTESHTVSVAPDPYGGRSYATTTDLAVWLGDAVPELAPSLLARATRVVDTLTRGLAWDPAPGSQNLPSDAAVAAALRDGTCAQAAAWIAKGYADDLEPTDGDVAEEGAAELAELAAAGVTNVSFGTVTFGLGKTAAAAAGAAPDWTTPEDDTIAVLRVAGVYPVRPVVLK